MVTVSPTKQVAAVSSSSSVNEKGDKMCNEPTQAKKGKLYTRKEVEIQGAEGVYMFIVEKQVYKVPDIWAREHHPGGHILMLDAKGSDISMPFLNNHDMSVTQPILDRFHVGYVEDSLSPMEEEFIDIIKTTRDDPSWFKCDPFFYASLMTRYLVLLALSIACILYGESGWIRCGLGGLLMGAYFQQVAFLGHDLGHNGVTHDRYTDSMIGFFWGNFMSGISVCWWKATHNVHHLVTNSVEYDPDIQHMPFFAVTEKFFNNIYSQYHMKTFVFDKASQFLLQYQHILYYPILAFARFNLYVQSFILILAPGDVYRRWGGNYRTIEFATLGGFWSWFVYLISCLPTWQEKLGFLFLSHAVAGMLHVQITISHFPMPVIDGNPLQHKTMNWIQVQLSGSLDVDCPPSMDWFHGGLQFQAVHHCITRVPRHNLRRLRQEILLPFCKKHNLQYKQAGFVECNMMVIDTLRRTADKISPFLLDAVNAVG